MFSSSTPSIHRTNSFSHNPSLPDSIAGARETIGRGDAHGAIRDLSSTLGGDQRAFHDAILNLLDSLPSSTRQELIKETLSQRADFNLNAFNKEGKTVLDLAVRHDDRELAQYLLRKGAKPEQTSLSTASSEMQVLLTSWRRKNLLYAHTHEGKSLSPLEHMLLEGRHKEVREQLESILPKYENVPKFWAGMLEAGVHDILRAFLVVGTPNELHELTQDKYLVGQWIKEFKELRNDPGLLTVLKEFSYQSGKRGEPDNFNGVAKFPDIDVEINCRYLATYQQVQQAKNPKIKFDYNEFSSPGKISRNVKLGIIDIYSALKAQASETHLIDNKKFGQFLARQFESMGKDGKQSKLMLMQSTNHVMNLGLRIKEKDGKKSYVVKFFDPNDTTTGTRSKANTEKTFETQTLGSYITDTRDMELYYPEPLGMSMIFVRTEANAPASSSTTHSATIGRTLTSMDIEDIDATAIWHLTKEGFAGSLRQLHGHFSTLPEDKRIEFLAATNDDGYPAFYMCMGDDNVETIRAYVDLVKLVSPDKQADLFLTKASDGPFKGESSLQYALGCKSLKAVNEVLPLLKQLAPDLSPERRIELREELNVYEKTIGNQNRSILGIFRKDVERSKMQNLFVELKAELEE